MSGNGEFGGRSLAVHALAPGGGGSERGYHHPSRTINVLSDPNAQIGCTLLSFSQVVNGKYILGLLHRIWTRGLFTVTSELSSVFALTLHSTVLLLAPMVLFSSDWARYFAAISVPLLLVHSTSLARGNTRMGFLVGMLISVWRDMLEFTVRATARCTTRPWLPCALNLRSQPISSQVIMLLSMFGAALVFWLLGPGSDAYGGPTAALFSSFLLLLGDFDSEIYSSSPLSMALFVTFAGMVLSMRHASCWAENTAHCMALVVTSRPPPLPPFWHPRGSPPPPLLPCRRFRGRCRALSVTRISLLHQLRL